MLFPGVGKHRGSATHSCLRNGKQTGQCSRGGQKGVLLRWPVLPEIVTRTKHVFHSFFRTVQVRAVLFWALPKAAWRATSSKKLEGNTKFLGSDEEISSDHRRRDASAQVRGTGGQRSLFNKGKQRKWDVFFSKGKLQRENQLWPFATHAQRFRSHPAKSECSTVLLPLPPWGGYEQREGRNWPLRAGSGHQRNP